MAEPTTVEEVVVTGKRKKPNFAVRAARTARRAVRDPGAFVKGAKELPGAVVRGVKNYARTHTPQQFGEDVVRTGKNIVSDVAENPVQTVLGALPFVGGAMSAIDTAKARESAADARARGDERTAQMYEQIAAASAGTILAGMLPGGRTVAKGLLKEGEQAAVREAEKLAARYGLPEFTTDLTPAQIEANRASFLEGNHPDVPDVVYHGSREDIPNFQVGHPTQADKGWLGSGVYTASDAPLAAMYASKKSGSASPNIMPLHPSLKNPYMATLADKQALRHADEDTIRAVTDALKAAGHDGVLLTYPGGEKEAVVFDPSQLKSTMNRGTFDPNEPHLNKAMGGLIEKYAEGGPVAPGNIDLHNRPVVHNPDGSISTVRSITVGFGDKTYVLPRVVGGKVVSNREAIDHFRQTGEHLGAFGKQKDADAYAQRLHEDQAKEYEGKARGGLMAKYGL